MKTSKLAYAVWVFFALALVTTSAFGQGRGNGYRYIQKENVSCLYGISGLNEDQQKQIEKLENKHQGVMAEFREKRRSTTNAIEKSEIRTEMLKKVEAHRKEVRSVFTEDQQKQYDLLHTYGNYGQNQNMGRGRANGNHNFVRRGNGRGNFVRGNKGAYYNHANFCGRGGSFQNGNGRGSGNRANFGRGNNRKFHQGPCVNVRSIDTCGFRIIPEKEFE